jgi:hypothetical protein
MSVKQRTDRDQRGRFAPGHAGRTPGYRHKITRDIEAIMEGEAEALSRKAVELALHGDMTALRLCLERLAPVRKDIPVVFEMPTIKSIDDHPGALASIITAVTCGDLTPSEGQALAAMLAEHRKAIETVDHEARLKRLEELRDVTT